MVRVERKGRTYRLVLANHERNGSKMDGAVIEMVLSKNGKRLTYDRYELRRTRRRR